MARRQFAAPAGAPFMRHAVTSVVAVLLLSFALVAPASAAAAGSIASAVSTVRDLLRDGKTDAAVEASQKAVAVHADAAELWWWAGRAYGRKAQQSGMFAAAKWAGRTREAFEKAVEIDPAHIGARFDLMGYYLMAPGIMGGSRDKAAAQARAIADRDASMGKLAEANLAASDKQPERAQALIDQALALDPDNLQARMSLAMRAAREENWPAVRSLWQAQLQREKHHPTAHYQLARAAAITGEQLEDGLAHIDAFLASDDRPHDLTAAAAHWRRGQILDQLGRREEAIAALRLAVDSRDVGEQAKADLERINKG
jgi:tetratricopeptide (TPR) repeat protein